MEKKIEYACSCEFYWKHEATKAGLTFLALDSLSNFFGQLFEVNAFALDTMILYDHDRLANIQILEMLKQKAVCDNI